MDKGEEFHEVVTNAIAGFMTDHREDAGVVTLRLLVVLALAYEDSLDGGRRTDDMLRQLGR